MRSFSHIDYSLNVGIAIDILEITTCVIPFTGAILDVPRGLPSISVTSTPASNSLDKQGMTLTNSNSCA